MYKLVLRNLWAYKRKLLTSAFAIVLGVSFLCGSFIFTDTLKGLFSDLFTSGSKGVDTVVRASRGLEEGGGRRDGGPYGDGQSLIDVNQGKVIGEAPGVAAIEPFYQGYAQMINKKGKLVKTGGAPTFGFLWVTDSELASYKIFSGRPPAGDNEIVVDRALIKTTGYKVGDTVEVNTSGPKRKFKIVGDATFGTSDSALGASAVFFTPKRGTELMGKPGQVQGFLVRAEKGFTQRELARSVRTKTDSMQTVSGTKIEALTGEALALETQAILNTVFKFINYFFTAFAVIALFVSVFVIANSFSIVITQRNKEMAMLRTLGASRKQVVLSTFVETLIVGLLASAVGIIAGLGVAWLIRISLKVAFGSGLPSTGFILLPRTIILGMVVGTGVTVVSAVFPALRASRVKPLAALQASSLDRAAASKVRIAFGFLFVLASVALLVIGLRGTGGTGARNVGIAAGLFLVATIFLGPFAARPVAGLLGRRWYGWVIAIFGAFFGVFATLGMAGGLGLVVKRFINDPGFWNGILIVLVALLVPVMAIAGWTLVRTGLKAGNVTGQIARENSVRNPTRTSATALALTIGTAVVCAILVLSQSLKGTFEGALNTSVKSDFVVTSGTDNGFPAEVEERVKKVPGYVASSGQRFTRSEFRGKPRGMGIVDPVGISQVVDLGDVQGDMAKLKEPNTIAIDAKSAKDEKLKLGDMLDEQFPSGVKASLKLVAIYNNAEGLGNTYYLIGRENGQVYSPSEVTNFIYVKSDGKNRKAFQKSADTALGDFPSAELKTKKQFADEQLGQFNNILGLVNALLALAIIIAVLGIANTLKLSIFERIREIGLLRAIGQSRDQVGAMIRWEAIVVATFGALLGMLIGTGFGTALVRVLAKDGTIKLSIPIGLILGLALVASLVGLFAARKPAKDAARMNILQAIATE
jgi:putative ABC transport system permease protein